MPVAPSRLVVVFLLSAGAAACSADARRFPLRDPIWRDGDLAPVSVACRPDPDTGGAPRCAPTKTASSVLEDAADTTVLRPVARFFAVDPAGAATNVNSVDEVPDSAWFTNRIGLVGAAMTPEGLVRGPCGDAAIDPTAPDGTWVIDGGSVVGEAPSFVVVVAGRGRFVISVDGAGQPERATGAAAIASRLYYAAGYWAPCASVVHVRPAIFALSPGFTLPSASGAPRALDAAALAQLLAAAPSRGGLVRVVATRALPGSELGPFRYEGTRGDDPNDVVAHEDRRDLRGARVLAAWLDHGDASEHRTRDTWIARRGDEVLSSPGIVRHYQVGLDDCFGREADTDAASRRIGHENSLDLAQGTRDFLTLGVQEQPWDRAKRSADGDVFGYFSARDFAPGLYRGDHPNPAFSRMMEGDGAWAARAVARFTPDLVEAAVRAGDFTFPRHTEFLIEQLLLRRKAVLRRYFARLSPIADVRVSGEDLCGNDLARSTATFGDAAFAYRARTYAGADLAPRSSPVARLGAGGEICLTVPHVADDGGARDDAASRYVVVDLFNGVAPGPLRAHLYDLGPRRGFRLVGLERPDDDSAPD
ncbi:MAG: hypothetical protein ABJE95_03025 [Byssovorax sp.]